MLEKYGTQVPDFDKKMLDVSKTQFLHVLDLLYEKFKSAFRIGMATKHLCTYELLYDKIRVYDAIDQDFGLGGDKKMLIQHFETIINEKYHSWLC